MSDPMFVYDDRQVLLISARQLTAEVLRACRVGDFNFLGFAAGLDADRLLLAEDSRGAAAPHYAARNGQLSVLRSVFSSAEVYILVIEISIRSRSHLRDLSFGSDNRETITQWHNHGGGPRVWTPLKTSYTKV